MFIRRYLHLPRPISFRRHIIRLEKWPYWHGFDNATMKYESPKQSCNARLCLCCTRLSHTLSNPLKSHLICLEHAHTLFWRANINVTRPRDVLSLSVHHDRLQNPSFPSTVKDAEIRRRVALHNCGRKEFNRLSDHFDPYISAGQISGPDAGPSDSVTLFWAIWMHEHKCFSYLNCMILNSSTFRIQCEAQATALVSVTMVANDNWLYIVGWRCIYLCKYQHNHVAQHCLFESPLLPCQGPITWTNKAGVPPVDRDVTLTPPEMLRFSTYVHTSQSRWNNEPLQDRMIRKDRLMRWIMFFDIDMLIKSEVSKLLEFWMLVGVSIREKKKMATLATTLGILTVLKTTQSYVWEFIYISKGYQQLWQDECST